MSRLQLVLVLTSVLNSKLQYTYKNELRNIPFHATYVWVVCTLHNILLNYSSELIQVLPSFLSSRYSVSVCTVLSFPCVPFPPSSSFLVYSHLLCFLLIPAPFSFSHLTPHQDQEHTRPGNLLIGFLSESIIFCEKMSE